MIDLNVYQTAAGNGCHVLEEGIVAVSWFLCEGPPWFGVAEEIG